MQSKTYLHILNNNEIDKSRWDECIANSPAGLIYARSFYLDNICENWSALTAENYEWVLPLTWRKKYGITYLYQPSFCQQLGVFAKPGIVVPYQKILNSLQQHYMFWEINWNCYFKYKIESKYAEMKKGTDFLLNLHQPYETIFKNYHRDLQKNLKQNFKYRLSYNQTTDFENCIALYKKFYGKRMPHVKDQDYKNLKNICILEQEKNMLVCRQATNETNEMLAAALILFDGKRLYNLVNITTPEGRKAAANHFLLDGVIKEFSGQNLSLDFEGSDLPGVKTFYENFGGIDKPYNVIKYNNLPWPLNFFKQ